MRKSNSYNCKTSNKIRLFRLIKHSRALFGRIMKKERLPFKGSRSSIDCFILCVSFNLFTCIYKCFDPWGNLIVFLAIVRVVTALPRENGPFRMRHHSKMSSIFAANAGNGIW